MDAIMGAATENELAPAGTGSKLKTKHADFNGTNTQIQDEVANPIATGVMRNDDWLERLQVLAERFSYLGMTADMGAMGLVDLWGLYCLLSRLAGDA